MKPDFTDTHKMAERLTDATRKLQQMSDDVGHARQVKEFVSDLKKNLLAKYVVRALKAGESATAAEAIGRADTEFQRELEALAAQAEASEKVIAKWQATQCTFDAARSLLSFSKAALQELNG